MDTPTFFTVGSFSGVSGTVSWICKWSFQFDTGFLMEGFIGLEVFMDLERFIGIRSFSLDVKFFHRTGRSFKGFGWNFSSDSKRALK